MRLRLNIRKTPPFGDSQLRDHGVRTNSIVTFYANSDDENQLAKSGSGRVEQPGPGQLPLGGFSRIWVVSRGTGTGTSRAGLATRS
jgi:hypothetical protein